MRSWKRLVRLSWWPALAGAVVPKCPLCVAAYLSALGAGAGVASAVAPTVIRASHLAAVLGAAMLGKRVLAWVRRAWRARSGAREPLT